MWVARDKNYTLWLYREKPYRNEIYESWQCNDNSNDIVGSLDITMFPDLKWEDEPLEVILIKKKRK